MFFEAIIIRLLGHKSVLNINFENYATCDCIEEFIDALNSINMDMSLFCVCMTLKQTFCQL